MRHGRCLLSLLLFNIVLEFLAITKSQEEEIKAIQIGKEVIKLSLLSTQKIPRNLQTINKNQTNKNLLELSEFSKNTEYKVNIQK